MPTNSLARRGRRARNRSIETWRQHGWEGGWRPDLADSTASPDTILELQDVEWVAGYGLRKRRGYTLVTSTIEEELGG